MRASSPVTHRMNLIPPHPPWKATLPRPDTIRLETEVPLRNSWYLVRIRGGGAVPSPPQMKRGGHPGGSYLRPGRRKGEWELVFFHAQPLTNLQLDLPSPVAGSAEVRIAIASIATPRAVFGMLQAVSDEDRSAGDDPSRVYRKSWARWRRHGWDGFLLRLIREYQPQEVLSFLVQDPYGKWIETVEAPDLADRAAVRAAVAALPSPPYFTVFVTAGTAPQPLREQTIRSVLAQSYPHIELSVGADEDLSRVRGDYVAFVEPGDELAEDALFFVAGAIAQNPAATLLYSDEDRIDGERRRFSPQFKPDWNPDLFLSHNYLSDLCVCRRDVLTAAGGSPACPEAGGRFDLLLRALPYLGEEVVHIPRILYHRRALNGDEAAPPPSPVAAVRDYFLRASRSGVAVEAGLAPGACRVRYPLPEPAPQVSLLIPTRDRRELLETCVRSILDKTAYGNFEILILDNQSRNADTLEFFRRIQEEDGRVRVISYDRPFNYSAINNFGVRHARGEIIGLLNNDIEAIGSDWLGEMVSQACRPEIGCVGAKLYYPDDTIQHAGVILGLWGVAGHSHKHFPRPAAGYGNRLLAVQNYSAVTAACLLVRRRVYEEVGGLNERDLAVSFNDVDFCLKVRRAGYRNLWTPYAELYHHESVSRGSEDTPEKKERERREIAYMKSAWEEELRHDPAYNPHLTRHLEDFSINLDHILFPPPAEGIEEK